MSPSVKKSGGGIEDSGQRTCPPDRCVCWTAEVYGLFRRASPGGRKAVGDYRSPRRFAWAMVLEPVTMAVGDIEAPDGYLSDGPISRWRVISTDRSPSPTQIDPSWTVTCSFIIR